MLYAATVGHNLYAVFFIRRWKGLFQPLVEPLDNLGSEYLRAEILVRIDCNLFTSDDNIATFALEPAILQAQILGLIVGKILLYGTHSLFLVVSSRSGRDNEQTDGDSEKPP